MKINPFNAHNKAAGTVNALMAAAFLATASFAASPALASSAKQAQAASAKATSARAPSVASLIRLNMQIWGCVGWQIGRMQTLAKYGIDIGARCPR